MNPALSLYDHLAVCPPAVPPKDITKLHDLIGNLSTAQTLAKRRDDKEVLSAAMRSVDKIINEPDPVWQKIMRVYPPSKMR